jgi:hypothetical protein
MRKRLELSLELCADDYFLFICADTKQADAREPVVCLDFQSGNVKEKVDCID